MDLEFISESIDEKLTRLREMQRACESQNRLPTPAERKEADKILQMIDDLEKSEEALRAIDDRLKGYPSQFKGRSMTMERNVRYNDDGTVTPASRINSRGIFGDASRLDHGGFKGGMGEYFSTLITNPHDKRLTNLRNQAMQEGSFSEGGALVPDQFSAQLMQLIVERSALLPRCDIYPMERETLKIPGVDDSDHSTDRAGLVATWKAELASLDLDAIRTRQIELHARKLTLLIKCSSEFMADATNADRFVRTTMAAEAAWQLDNALINGTGASMGLGLLEAPCLKVVDKETGQTAGTLIWENICRMYEALNPTGEDDALWLISPSLKSEAMNLTVAIGTAGQGFFPSLSVATGKMTLLNKPVVWTEHLKRAGQQGDVVLVNPGGIIVGLRQSAQIDVSPHVYFTQDAVAFRLTLRCDFQPKMSSALILNDATTVVSDVVTLQARS